MTEVNNRLIADALPLNNNISRINIDFNFDLEVLKNIEKDLQDYEKLSLLFLILEDYNCFEALYPVFYEQNVEHILSDLVDKIENWQTKFYEALCITKAKKEIRMLGKSFDELERIYVPVAMNTDPRVSDGSKVHLGAKLLFHLFDYVLEDDQRKRLIENIYKEIERPDSFKDDDAMEIHALYWVQRGFITLALDGYGDFQKLLKHLKRIGLSDHPTYFDLQKYSENSVEQLKNFSPKPQQIESHVPKENIRDQSPTPALPPQNIIQNAYVIILNIITIPNTEYADRDSSNVDVVKLKCTFQGLGYKFCHIYNEPTESEIKQIFHDVKTKFDRKKNDGLIVCILSHGIKGHFVSHDNVEVPLSRVETAICIPELQSLPKIVMVQACQGDKIGRAIKTDLVADGPSNEDDNEKLINTLNHDQFLQFSSTMRDCQAIRHKENGSWFIEAVCEVFQKSKESNPPLSVNKWTQGVKRLVRGNRGELEKGLIAAQLPEVTYERFVDDFYFPIYRNGEQN